MKMHHYDAPPSPTSEFFSKPLENNDDVEIDAMFADLFEAGSTDDEQASAQLRGKLVITDSVTATAAAHPLPTATRPAASMGKSAVAVATPGCAYAFPHSDDHFLVACKEAENLDDNALVARLKKLIDQGNAKSPTGDPATDYSAIRMEACALAISLNKRQIHPPILRTWVSISQPHRITDAQKLASNDLQVIDLHWLHCSGFGAPHSRWSDIFGDTFEFSQAGRFAAGVGAVANKAAELGLVHHEMLSMRMLRTECVRKRQLDIRDQRLSAVSAIRTAMADPKCRQNCSSEEMVWTYTALLYSHLNDSQAIKFAQQAFGLDLSKQSVARRRKWLLARGIIHPVRS